MISDNQRTNLFVGALLVGGAIVEAAGAPEAVVASVLALGLRMMVAVDAATAAYVAVPHHVALHGVREARTIQLDVCDGCRSDAKWTRNGRRKERCALVYGVVLRFFGVATRKRTFSN